MTGPLPYEKNARALSSDATRTSTSERVLYMPNEARHVDVR
jgi:hypothetical protein